MKDAVVERVRLIIDTEANGSETRFGKIIGIPQGTLNCQLNGKRGISYETINAILVTFPHLSAEWLMRGTGDSLTKERNTEAPIMTNEEIMNAMQTLTALTAKVQELYNENRRLKEQLSKQ